ncbi:MAG: single-stranded-DNA-specific exonuclease RecJ [Firmicutes bacterium]|nr:single-stranded-DNA-specific exonuclease RecJ [Bacillota bacterium]MDH7495581.1 single-stranded-DNA-specific exonuclease RecJ [Bacillota bacterium]
MAGRVWSVAGLSRDSEETSKALARELRIPLLVARVMLLRGYASPSAAQEFLRADMGDLLDPFLLPDMELAVVRVLRALRNGERIRIYGDYDVDGITSTCVLLDVLRTLGANVDYYIPGRLHEGYGLNLEAVERAASAGVSLIITVDCGITAVEEVNLAAKRGIDVIVTDHHEPSHVLPRAHALVNPKRRDQTYAFPDLAGVGVAYKLASALLRAHAGTLDAPVPSDELLELVALGTIADVAPLTGENRILVKHGLARLSTAPNPGIQALIQVSGLTGREIGAAAVGFFLGPRLNAAGRLGDASLCVDLLTAASPDDAERIASILDKANQERQSLEQAILDEAASMVKTSEDGEAEDAVIVLAGEGWHPGVIGVVASRLVERFWRPVILISMEGDEGRGSGRSIDSFDLYGGLVQCKDLLKEFGGHRRAAGLSLSRSAVDALRERLNQIGRSTLTPEDLTRKVVCDLEVRFGEIDLAAAEGLGMMAPFGEGNPVPTFLSTGVRPVEYRGVGAEARHLKMKLAQDGVVLDAIGFGLGSKAPVLFARGARELDVLYTIEVNQWNGAKQVQLNVKELREAVRS